MVIIRALARQKRSTRRQILPSGGIPRTPSLDPPPRCRRDDIDLKALAVGRVRWCAINTGNEGQDRNWGDTICLTDGTLSEATANTATPEVQYLVIGSSELAMPDNIVYQPGRGSWIIHEDGDGPEVGRNNDLWSCLDDGGDPDHATGTRFFVSIQHNVTGHGVILEITGWR